MLVEDYPLILDGLEKLFLLGKDFHLMARCTDRIGTLRAMRQHQPDVVVFDIRMRGKHWLEVAPSFLNDLSSRIVV